MLIISSTLIFILLSTTLASQKRKGTATHYGPWDLIHYSEVGYQPLDVGVGCSNGEPGGDPSWNSILEKGVHVGLVDHPANTKTVWPKEHCVAGLFKR
jgi:hypothetical protein